VLYPFAPWEGNAATFVNAIGATMGPLFGIIMVDYYLIRKGVLDVAALYQEHGEFRFQGGWHVPAFIAAGIGTVFSSILPNFTALLPSWWAVYGWFFGVAIGGVTYYALRLAMPAARPQRAT
jgi:NCS1 family nucleobase:cation symporter-1